MENDIDYTFYRKHLSNIAMLTDEEWECLAAMLSTRYYKKKELFHAEGKVCQTVGFIMEGCFRSVRNVDGNEKTFDFAIEHEFVTDYHSIITKSVSQVSILAVEDSIVVSADAERMLALFDTTMTWQKIGRHLAEYVACYYQERLIASYYETPKMRYERLMKTSSQLFLRIPHHILANYLGLTKETLSRLRNSSRKV
ncbi:Crp/Fnr family transcriptional regulator [Chitinophaga sp. G-6-1-13]|uniref:Crp/Fnr family transcriptional regulator n=1 Tax=Chitinophaga fulva TaxID=2728842 RepID=A0A848GSV0_9BACT|nr:Crp/Fnr family transcriptional regulator [Chitinophaga fulva]NML39710.1 Crp/Fnr family transcriptional regulator [Chitinophaga fulva]